MYWGDVFTSPLFFINFPAYKNYTLTISSFYIRYYSQLTKVVKDVLHHTTEWDKRQQKLISLLLELVMPVL